MNTINLADLFRDQSAHVAAASCGRIIMAVTTDTRISPRWTGTVHALSSAEFDRQASNDSVQVAIQSGFARECAGFDVLPCIRQYLTLYTSRLRSLVDLNPEQLKQIVEGRLTDWNEIGATGGKIRMYRLRPNEDGAQRYSEVLDRRLDLALMGLGTSLNGARGMIELDSYQELAAAAERDRGALLFGLREARLTGVAPVAINGRSLYLTPDCNRWPLAYDVNIAVRCSLEGEAALRVAAGTIRERYRRDIAEMSALQVLFGTVASHEAVLRRAA